MPRDLRLTAFAQTVQEIGDAQSHRILTFPGLAPIVIRADAVPLVYQQSGQATAFRARFVPPQPYGGDAAAVLLEPPQASYRRDDDGLHWHTTWGYTYTLAVAMDDEDRDALGKWPATPVFEEVS